MSPEEMKKASKELEKLLDDHLGIRSTFAADNWRLLATLLSTIALYLAYDYSSPARPGRFALPSHNIYWMLLLFLLCALAIAPAVRVAVRGWRIWQRQVATLLLIPPGLFLFAYALWLIKRML